MKHIAGIQDRSVHAVSHDAQGVQQHRCQNFEEAHKFMRMALTLLGNVCSWLWNNCCLTRVRAANIGSSLEILATDLHAQYQSISDVGGATIILHA